VAKKKIEGLFEPNKRKKRKGKYKKKMPANFKKSVGQGKPR
tara:strand:- start:3 stop:125 length:123 start_codon:yes stop_codon:yes gene_type:complete